jgi:UDP-2-acetamido-3-amino-2,3-dideoxy-glucuronate N-acetyltransferase
LGVPARQAGWMSQLGERMPLPLSGVDEYLCEKTKSVYKLKGEALELVKIWL